MKNSMASITKQEFFTKAVEHMRKQGKQAICAEGRCVYLTPDGLKCVIGSFIPDGHPAQVSTLSIGGLSEDHPDLKGIAWPAGRVGLKLAQNMQLIHDCDSNWNDGGFGENGENRVKLIAEKYQLEYKAPCK